jgi:hypothetical protein
MNETGKGSKLWHLDRAAHFDQQAQRHDRRRMYYDADIARADAQKHRDAAQLIMLEEQAAA